MWVTLTLKEGNRPIWIWRSHQQDIAVRRAEVGDATIISTACGVFAVTEAVPATLHLLGMKDLPMP